jgi:hypothetical protein
MTQEEIDKERRQSRERTKRYFEKNKEKIHKRKNEKQKYEKLILRKFKRHYGCKSCGKKEGVLHFHHLNREEKEHGVTRIQSLSIERKIKEIGKCVVLCYNCHIKKDSSLINSDNTDPIGFEDAKKTLIKVYIDTNIDEDSDTN